MKSVSITKHIAAPCEAVFARAADFPRAAEHVRGITRVEMLTEGPVGMGTRFRETRVMFGREASEVMEVTAFEPSKRYVVEAESCGCHYRSEFRFKPSGNGTDMEMVFGAQPLTWMAKIMGILMAPMMKKMVLGCVVKDLDDIAASFDRPNVAPA